MYVIWVLYPLYTNILYNQQLEKTLSGSRLDSDCCFLSQRQSFKFLRYNVYYCSIHTFSRNTMIRLQTTVRVVTKGRTQIVAEALGRDFFACGEFVEVSDLDPFPS